MYGLFCPPFLRVVDHLGDIPPMVSFEPGKRLVQPYGSTALSIRDSSGPTC